MWKSLLMPVMLIVVAENFACVEAFGDAVGQEICAGFTGWVAALVENQVGQNGHRDADPVGLPGGTLKQKEEKSQQFIGMQGQIELAAVFFMGCL